MVFNTRVIMSKINDTYDKTISKSYDCSLNQEIFSVTRSSCLEQIKEIYDKYQPIKTLDLGVGDGQYIEKLSKYYTNIEAHGIDSSSEMLKKALYKESFNGVKGKIEESGKYFKHRYFDLINAHFICCYVGLDEIFKLSDNLLNKDGVISLCTSTHDSWSKIQAHMKNHQGSNNTIRKLLFKYTNYISYNNNQSPRSHEEIVSNAESHDYSMIMCKKCTIRQTLHSVDEALAFFIKGSWGAHSYRLPYWMLQLLTKHAFSDIEFPFTDNHKISICTFKKNREI